MHCQYTNTETFSDLVAAQQRITNSATFKKFERKLQSAAARECSMTRTINPVLAALTFALLWGVGLMGVLEADNVPAQAAIIIVLTATSFGLDRFFYDWQ